MCECVRVCVKPRLEVRARLWGCACLQGESCSWACNAKRLQHGKALDTWCFYGQVFATTTTTTATKRHITVREECTNKNKTLAVHAMRARAGVEWLALRIRRVVSEGVSQAQRRWSNNQRPCTLDWLDLYLSFWFEYQLPARQGELKRTGSQLFSAPSPFELCHLANANVIRNSKI